MKLDAEINLKPREFFQWWGEQLVRLVPPSLVATVYPQRSYICCKLSEQELDAIIYRDQTHPSSDFRLPLAELGTDSLEHFIEQHFAEKPVQVFLLKKGQYLKKELILPAAAAENLQQVVSFELDRQTPFKPGQVYFQASISEQLPVTHQIKVTLVLIPKTRLDALLQELSEIGFHPEVIDIDESLRSIRYRPIYNLLPDERRSKERNWIKITTTVLIFIVLLLLSATIALPLFEDQIKIEALRDELDKVGRVALKVEGLKSDADRLLEETNFLLEKKRNEPVLVDVINEMTRRLPDETWLTSLRFNDARLQVQGNSPSASTLIETIEASELFENTRFVSPVTQNPSTRLERFQIETDVIARKSVVPESH